MRKIIFLAAFLTFVLSNISAQSNTDNQLTITIEDKKVEATAICLDAIESPTKYNEFAKQFISLPNFPQKTNFITAKELKIKIESWLLEHPKEIDKILLERKKAHDILYGPRPY